MVVGFIIHVPHDLLIREIVVGDGSGHGTANILLTEFTLITCHTFAVTLA
jgi:hypothetical protein